MNYLSHHTVAKQVQQEASPWFYIGNLLPDLISISGAGRLRRAHLVSLQPATPEETDLLTGIRLHLATDDRFHGHTAFREATATATRLLQETPFDEPPPRLFFVAHVAVELSLDGNALQQTPIIADDLYTQLARCGPVKVAEAAQSLLAQPVAATLTDYLPRFLEWRFLEDYRTFAGQTRALQRVMHRANLSGFSTAADEERLTEFFAKLGPLLLSYEADLLAPPESFSAVTKVEHDIKSA
jgi:hypothetical protein